jgi:antitoxin HicB
MLTIYPAIFHNENGSYWVEFPDLEGCQSCGESIPETMSMAQEALGLYLVSLLEDNVTPPKPSNIFALKTDETSFSTLVSVDIDAYRRNTKAVKKTLSIPAWLNEEAEKRHVNFSSLLQDALKKELSSR